MEDPIPATQKSPQYGWRKIEDDDIQRGTVIRLKNMMRDGGYCMATIIGVHDSNLMEDYITVARPYVYAHEAFNTNQPLLGAEVFEITLRRMLSADSDVEVFQERKDVHRMAT